MICADSYNHIFRHFIYFNKFTYLLLLNEVCHVEQNVNRGAILQPNHQRLPSDIVLLLSILFNELIIIILA
jgi:hypothetical protein